MDFEFTEEQAMIRTTVRDFAEKEIAPNSRDNNRNEHFPMEIAKKMGEMGFLGLSLPLEYGGGGADHISYCLMCEELGRVVRVSLSDTGPGVPVSVQGQVFEPFFSTKEDGTGLGLSIAERIVNEHGGKLEFRSVEGEGATFIINLPVSEEA